MGSYYSRYISDRDPIDDCYDWPITGIPGDQLREGGLDNTSDAYYADERWKETELRDVWASNYGRFYDHENDRMMSTYPMKTGYREIKKYYDGKQHHLSVHRALGKAFIDNPHNDPVVRHLDDNRENNDLENLAWGTYKENVQDSIDHGTFCYIGKENLEKAVTKRSRAVIATNLNTGEELYFKSMHDAARKLELPVESICNIVNKKPKFKTAGGYTFKAS